MTVEGFISYSYKYTHTLDKGLVVLSSVGTTNGFDWSAGFLECLLHGRLLLVSSRLLAISIWLSHQPQHNNITHFSTA